MSPDSSPISMLSTADSAKHSTYLRRCRIDSRFLGLMLLAGYRGQYGRDGRTDGR